MIFLKAIPCFLLMWFTLALMFRLQKNNAKRSLLLYAKNCPIDKKRIRKRRKNYDRTTFTLIVMLLIFLVNFKIIYVVGKTDILF